MRKSEYKGTYGEPLRKRNHYSPMDIFTMALGAVAFLASIIGLAALAWAYFVTA